MLLFHYPLERPVCKFLGVETRANLLPNDMSWIPPSGAFDYNTLVKAGSYMITKESGNVVNAPTSSGFYFLYVFTYGNNIRQIAMPDNRDSIYLRVKTSGVWSTWREL